MLRLSEIKEILNRDTIKVAAVARGCNMEYHQVRGVLKNANPLYLSVEKISDYIEKNNLHLINSDYEKVGE